MTEIFPLVTLELGMIEFSITSVNEFKILEASSPPPPQETNKMKKKQKKYMLPKVKINQEP